MTILRDAFSHLDDLDVAGIHARISALKEPFQGNFEAMDDDSLAELLHLNRLLRKKVATSNSGAKRRAPKGPATLEDLA